jgi:hypothetical protein
MGLMEAAMDDLMRHSNHESSLGWEYEAIEIVERLDDMIDDWFVGADDAVVHDELPLESRLGSTLFFGSITLATVGGVVATLVQ